MYFDLRNQGLQIYSCKGVAFHIKQKSYGQSSQSAAAVEKGFKFLCAIILPTPKPTLCCIGFGAVLLICKSLA